MDAEGGECLGGALAEANVAERRCLGNIEDVVDGVGNVMPGKVVNARRRSDFGILREECTHL